MIENTGKERNYRKTKNTRKRTTRRTTKKVKENGLPERRRENRVIGIR